MRQGSFDAIKKRGIKCSDEWKSQVGTSPGAVYSKSSQSVKMPVTPKLTGGFAIKNRPTNPNIARQSCLQQMAKFNTNIQSPIGTTARGDVIKNPSTKSIGLSQFGGNNPAVFFLKGVSKEKRRKTA